MRRILVFANGTISDLERVRSMLRPADVLFGVDGGTNHILALHLLPDVVIGDLDSLPPEVVENIRDSGKPFEVHKAEKDQTDLELALLKAVQAEADEILIIGAVGGRADHFLGNLLLLSQTQFRRKKVRIDDGLEAAGLIHDSITIEGSEGDIVSLFALSDQAEGITTSDLKYPLHDETLSLGETRGISNVMLGKSAQVTLKGGILLYIHTRVKGKVS